MNNYELYAMIESKIEELELQKSSLRTKILEEMVANKEKTKEVSVGKFSVSMLKKWTYTEKVAELEEDFKAQKAHEQSTGDATFEETPSLRFTGIKF